MDPKQTSGPLWHEGTVDTDREHLLLMYGEGDVDNDLPVALVGLGPRLDVTVQFLIAATGGDDRTVNILSELRQELDTYLTGDYPLEVWDDAKYRCMLPPNPSSKIHWRFCLDWDKDAHASAKWN
jgi:hypothetical protein